jgi:hypothetical protein
MNTLDMMLRMPRDSRAEQNDLPSSETTMNMIDLSIGSGQKLKCPLSLAI